ncbi:MAG: preprotein translocase subunit SecE [Pseudobdellovibrionaceae bacterium]
MTTNNTNSKILSLSFAIAAALIALTLHLLIKAFAGAFGVVARLADSDFVRHILPVLIGVLIFSVLQFNKKTLIWGEEVVSEIRKVVWPNRKDTANMTISVVIMVLISSVIVSVFDVFSGFIISKLIN